MGPCVEVVIRGWFTDAWMAWLVGGGWLIFNYPNRRSGARRTGRREWIIVAVIGPPDHSVCEPDNCVLPAFTYASTCSTTGQVSLSYIHSLSHTLPLSLSR